MSLLDKILPSSAPAAQQGNREVDLSGLPFDLKALRRRFVSAADLKMVAQYLAEFVRLDEVKRQARDIRRAEKAIEELRAAGVAVDDPELERVAYFEGRDKDSLAEAERRLGMGLLTKLSREITPLIRPASKRLREYMVEELKAIDAFEGATVKKWPGLVVPQQHLRPALQKSINWLSAELDGGPLDLTVHYDMRILLTQLFGDLPKV